jgi:hypothetical protein
MLAAHVVWLSIVSGGITALGGLGAFAAPRIFLRGTFGVEKPEPATLFLAVHWGALVIVLGALIVQSAYAPALRAPVLLAAAIEKFAIVGLVFAGPLKRTPTMTALACMDGAFALLYALYLLGV